MTIFYRRGHPSFRRGILPTDFRIAIRPAWSGNRLLARSRENPRGFPAVFTGEFDIPDLGHCNQEIIWPFDRCRRNEVQTDVVSPLLERDIHLELRIFFKFELAGRRIGRRDLQYCARRKSRRTFAYLEA